jgi:hypothetical protein
VLTCSTSSPARLSSILRLPIQKTHKGLVDALRGKPAQWQAEAGKYDPVLTKNRSRLGEQAKGHRSRGVPVAPLARDGRRALHRHRLLRSDARFRLRLVNVGTYRVQLLDRNHVALDMVPGKHGRIQYEKHKAAGKRLPGGESCSRRSARLSHLGDRGSVRHVRMDLHRRDSQAAGSGV